MPHILQFDGIIKNIAYSANLTDKLTEYEFSCFDVNAARQFGIIKLCGQSISYCKWSSPCHDSQYPFANIYKIYNSTIRVAIIPVMKDGGIDGQMEYMHHSILSWMNLGGIYIIFAFYDKANKSRYGKQRIVNQKINSECVKLQLARLLNYKSSAMCWNQNLFGGHFKKIYNQAIRAYEKISITTGIKTHPRKVKIEHYAKTREAFRKYEGIHLNRRKKHFFIDNRDLHNNKFIEKTKSIFYLIDKVGGIYYLTARDVLRIQNIFIVQETRRATQNLLPPVHQIQDALFRLSLFKSIDSLFYNGHDTELQAWLKLSGEKIIGRLFLPCDEKQFQSFIRRNKKNCREDEIHTLFKLKKESESNPHLIVIFEGDS